MPKKIKVRITDKVGAVFTLDGVKHLPGEIIEIPAKSFRPDHYEKVEPPAPKPKPKPKEPPSAKSAEETEETPTTEEAILE